MGIGLLIPLAWYWALGPFLRGEGPSPGAGAQYVFVLLPTIAVAAIALGVGAVLAYRAHRVSSQTHRTVARSLAILGRAGATILAVWLAQLAVRIASVAP